MTSSVSATFATVWETLKTALTLVIPLALLFNIFPAFRAGKCCLDGLWLLRKIKCDLPFRRQFQRRIELHAGLRHKSL